MNFNILKNFVDSLTDWIIPGNCVIVYKDGNKVFEHCSGYADLENNIKMDVDKQIFIYSCSKVVTVVAAMQLVEAGKMSLTDPLYKFIPEYKDMYIAAKDGSVKCNKDITIWNLFTMTAGFSYYTKSPCFLQAREITNGKMDTVTVAKCLASEPLCFEPTSSWKYSLCHDVLAAVVEIVSGMRFSEYVKQNIFVPLEMNNSYYHLTPDIEAKMAQQYVYDVNEDDIVKLQMEGNHLAQQGVVKNVGLNNNLILGDNYDSGGAGIITTPNDYAKFATALANGGIGINGNRIIKRETVELIRTNQIDERHSSNFSDGYRKGFGYGLGVRTIDNGEFCEFGWAGAAGANIMVDCKNRVGLFYAHHMLNPQEDYYEPRLRKALYDSING